MTRLTTVEWASPEECIRRLEKRMNVACALAGEAGSDYQRAIDSDARKWVAARTVTSGDVLLTWEGWQTVAEVIWRVDESTVEISAGVLVRCPEDAPCLILRDPTDGQRTRYMEGWG